MLQFIAQIPSQSHDKIWYRLQCNFYNPFNDYYFMWTFNCFYLDQRFFFSLSLSLFRKKIKTYPMKRAFKWLQCGKILNIKEQSIYFKLHQKSVYHMLEWNCSALIISYVIVIPIDSFHFLLRILSLFFFSWMVYLRDIDAFGCRLVNLIPMSRTLFFFFELWKSIEKGCWLEFW